MRVLRIILLLLIVALLSVPTTVIAAGQSAEQSEGQVEEQALEVLTRSTNYLANLKQFHVSAEFGFDVLQKSGQMIEFGAHQEITVQRPNHFRVDFTNRDGEFGSVIYDGEEVILSNPEDAVYAKAPFKGEVDDALGFISKELQRPIPLQDFFASNLGALLMAKIESGLYVEESTVGGVLCDHVAMRNDNVDFQLWVAQGDKPLPRRIIITYKNEEERPQFRAQFLKWELSPKIAKENFSFIVPEKTVRIPFAELDVLEGGQP